MNLEAMKAHTLRGETDQPLVGFVTPLHSTHDTMIHSFYKSLILC